MLVPSYSSKGFPKLSQIIDVTEPYIDAEILVSAYDIHRKYIKNSLTFPTLIFLDSGGYEASKDRDLSDYFDALGAEYEPQEWSEKDFEQVVATWSVLPPVVYINYDHPNSRIPLDDQIKRAMRTGGAGRSIAREFLIKTTTADRDFLDVDEIIAKVSQFAPFSVIGFTEKEIGSSLLHRMANIGRVRQALMSKGIETPIHIFGSLDTISTILYFVMGADVFDGLTWLRYAFEKGSTVYRQEMAATRYPANTTALNVTERCWQQNYTYLNEMVLEMRQFLLDGDFGVFSHNSVKIERLYHSALEEMGS
tara:strand:+ start:918 stop:1841 length:924 start_codon:yes stop_codon:yes gene_type:complete